MQRLSGKLRRFITPSVRRWRRLSGTHKTYFSVLLVIWLAVGTMAYVMAANHAFATTKSQNVGRLQQLKADIANLPSFSTVAPSQTSGNIPYVLQRRKELLQAVRTGVYAPRRPAIVFMLHPAYYSTDGGRQAYHEYSRMIGSQLSRTVKDTAGMQKFIEYTPLADLQSLSASDTDERLTRTKSGLLASQRAIRNSSLQGAAAFSGLLTPLIATVPSLDDKQKIGWADEVRSVQAQLLQGLMDADIQASDFAKRLDGLSALSD